jgi:6-phosphogluconolactonase
MKEYLYVTLSGEDRILIFGLDPATGDLESRRAFVLEGGPAPLALSPDNRFLYAGLRNSFRIASLRIDRSTGGLSPAGSVGLQSDPCFLATDRKGRYLLSSYYRAGRVAVHPIGRDGTASASPVEWRETALNAHSIQTDPSNRFAYVSHTGPNVIFQFLFDEETGRLSPNALPHVRPPEGTEPRHFTFHPRADLVYVVNERASSVTAYRFDVSAGTLSAFQTFSTLPAGFDGENTCAQIRITPTGRYLYASNRGHDSIAYFSIHETAGSLESLGQVKTETTPRAFNLDTSGSFLFAAGRTSGRLASYRIDPQTGHLEALKTYTLGERPMWVLPVRL